MRELRFEIVGVAQTKGSTRAFTPKGWSRPIITNDNPKAKSWASTIATAAALELGKPEHQGKQFAGPVVVEICFYFPRPKKFLTKKQATSDVPHTTRPDVDKAVRCAVDALTNVVWNDDAQVTDLIARKRYCAAGEFPRAVIHVRESFIGSGLFNNALTKEIA